MTIEPATPRPVSPAREALAGVGSDSVPTPVAPLGAQGGGGNEYLRDCWYMACLASTVKKAGLKREMLLGEPVLVGRGRDGKAFAMRDICPHRGVPLSAGRVLADNTVECPYHGWRFKGDGQCALIPSLVGGEAIEASKIKVRSYPVREQDGLIWVYMAAAGHESAAPRYEPPRVQVPNAKPRWMESQLFNCAIDHAVIGLMDPAHAPYVHGRWWWKVTPKEKAKNYAPLANGFVMTRHKPSKPMYGILGADVATEITFELPSVRFENITGTLFGRKNRRRRPHHLHAARRRHDAGDADFLLAGLARLHQAVLPRARPDLPGRRPPHGRTPEGGPEIQPIADADPGFRHAGDVVHAPQESLGGIGANRRTLRQSRAGKDAALAELTLFTSPAWGGRRAQRSRVGVSYYPRPAPHVPTRNASHFDLPMLGR